MNREQWLEALIAEARPMFEEAGKPLPQHVRAALCPPHRKMRAIGLCWHSTVSKDGGREIWVSTEYDDPVKVAGILIHELCHAALPDHVGHKKPFAILAAAMGLERPWTATRESEAFKVRWAEIIERIGPLPGSQFTGARPIGFRPQKWNGTVNLTCPSCDYMAKVQRKFHEIARLRCPIHGEEMLTREERRAG